MEPVRFHNATEYIAWRNTHLDDGYIAVKEKSGKWNLHSPDCWFISNPIEKGENLMSYAKYGSTNLERLKAVIEAEGSSLTTGCYCQQYGRTRRRGWH